ncbi:MAG: hypothetical protein GYA56_01440 [Geobacteraceae bacterium]|nr:hypothetical protein [Geobacteraceae bacterium]
MRRPLENPERIVLKVVQCDRAAVGNDYRVRLKANWGDRIHGGLTVEETHGLSGQDLQKGYSHDRGNSGG